VRAAVVVDLLFFFKADNLFPVAEWQKKKQNNPKDKWDASTAIS
jgi:hypothetical protein